MDDKAFYRCQRIEFDSMNDWMNDEWDLIRLESIILGYEALYGDEDTIKWNELIMKSMNEMMIDWLDLPSLSMIKGDGYNFFQIGKVQLDSNDWWLNLN